MTRAAGKTDSPTTDVAGEIADLEARVRLAARAFGALNRRGEGATPKDVVLEHAGTRLLRCRATHRDASRPPLLVVYALVNRYYMMDLEPGESLIGALVEAGIDVYLIDWGYPGPADAERTLTDYVEGHIGAAIDHVVRTHGRTDVDLLGVCQGGTFALCHAALHPERVKNLVTLVTPVDFQTPDNLLAHWVRGLDIDLLVDAYRLVPGALLNHLFVALKPFALGTGKYVALLDGVDDPARVERFVRMQGWIDDSPDQAGEAFRQFVKDLYQGNALVRGELTLGGRKVDLGAIRAPVLNVYASADHLVPPSASRPLGDLVGSEDYEALEVEAGHIGLFVSTRARERMAAHLVGWLAARA